MLNANNAGGGGAPREVLEAGSYPVRLVKVVDIGLQEQRPYKGEEKPPVNMVSLTYEFLDEFMKGEDGEDDETKPRWLTETLPFYNINVDRAKSTQRIKALDPELVTEGDVSKLLGFPAILTLVLNESKGKTYENVAGLAPMRKKDADKAPDLVNPTVLFDLDDPDMEVFNSFHKFTKEKITSNLEFNGSKLQALMGGEPEPENEELDDEVPY